MTGSRAPTLVAGRSKRGKKVDRRWTRRHLIGFGLAVAAAVGGLGLAGLALAARTFWLGGVAGLLIGLVNAREAWRLWSRHRTRP